MRSNQERRWAACFHAWRLPFEYEFAHFNLDALAHEINDVSLRIWRDANGHVVQDGQLGFYLPDFWFPELARGRVWMESRPTPIAGAVDGIPSEEETKLRCFGLACARNLLIDFSPCEFFVFIGGVPRLGSPLAEDHGGFRYGGARERDQRWCWCPHCRRYDVGAGGVPHLCPADPESVDPPLGGAFRRPTFDDAMVIQGYRAAARWDARRSWEDVG